MRGLCLANSLCKKGPPKCHMGNRLHSLKGVIWGTIIRVSKGDTRSLDDGSYCSRDLI